MAEKWADVTPEEKRKERFERFLSTEGINFVNPEAERAYKVRVQRLVDVYNVREPDRVPVSILLGAMPLYYAGIDLRTAMYDYDKAVQAYDKFNNEVDIDAFASPMVVSGKVYDSLDYKMYKWPGHGLPTDAAETQFVEGEYMKADEYDALIRDPSDFWLRVYLPRVFGALESFKMLQPFTNIIEQPNINSLMPFALPEVHDSLQTLIDVGKELSEQAKVMSIISRRGLELGFPITGGTFAKAPFDIIGDTLRGTQGIIMDIYRQPDKLLEALDVMADLMINLVISSTGDSRYLMATFPLHKGADGFMSEKHFETFYWPSLKKVILALLDEGLLVHLFAEGSYNTRLESVNEFPKGSISWLFDQTDMARAKRILGDSCCISGNVPSSLLATGTPEEVKEYCRQLIEDCGKGGGYILAPGAVSVETSVDNLKAMAEAAEEYGRYRY